MGKDKKLYVNEEIKAPNIIIIDEDGNKLGKFSRKEAMQKAYKEEKDLIQIHYDYKNKTSTVKLMEYGKYKYEQQKKRKKQSKNQNKGVKVIKIGYNIGKHDLKVKMDKIKEFLDDGYSVKVLGQLRGRENIYRKTMKEQVKKIARELSDISSTKGIKRENNGYSVFLQPNN